MNASIQRGEAIAATTFGPFSAEDLAAYARASGDDNPLHLDVALAAKAGLARPPIHGMLIMASLTPFIAHWRPGTTIRKLSAKFIEPVLIGEAFEVSGKVVQAAPGAPAVVRLTVRRGNDLVCLAEAFVA